MLIVIIDDNDEMRSMLMLTFQIKFPGATLMEFESPRDFLFHNLEKVDLVVCDYCFGHNTVEFYWEEMKKFPVVIFSGSYDVELDCLKIIRKQDMDILISMIQALSLPA
jgi:FixJ family two-component response regulator